MTKTLADRIDLTIAVHDKAWLALSNELRTYVRAVTLRTLTGTAADLELYHTHPDASIGVAIVLTNGAEIRDLNQRFRGIDKATNVLSFPADHEAPRLNAQELILGDIIIAYEVVVHEAEEQKKPIMAHLTHMIVHGLLHLIGHDHMEDAEAEQMEAYEREILASFGIADPYIAITERTAHAHG
jgi:probable rRNA maturation factor